MVKVKRNQSLFDIAMQHVGCTEAAIDIAILNDMSLTDDLSVDQLLEIPSVKNKQVVNYYSVRGIFPATAVTLADESGTKLGGIGYMAVKVDFIVS